MPFKDLLRGTVLLVAFVATGLAAISGVTINAAADDTLAALALAWWLIAIGGGIWIGRPDRTAAAVAGPLSEARTSTTLPAETPARIAFARLWPVILFAVLAGAAGVVLPQIPAIATGFALGVAAAWRNRDAAVTAIEQRDGVCFYVEPTSAFEPLKLIRTPGLKRGRPPIGKPPPPPSV